MSEDSKIKELISRYVGGEVTPEERLIVEKVLKESSAYHAFYEAMKKLNAILNKKTTLWRTLMELQQVKNKSFLVKAMIGCASLVFLSLIVFFAYILNLEKFVSVQNTLFYTQSEFEPGAKASLMAIVLNSKDAKPIEDAEIVIALGDTRTKKEKVLYKGKTSSTGSADIQFDMPVYPQGSYDLSIKVNSRYGHDKITKSVKIKKTFKVVLTTDKTLYQLGQSVYIRALALKSTDSTPVKNQDLTFEVRDAKGNKIFEQKKQTSEFGVVGTTFILANEMNAGEYTVKASAGDYFIEKKVEVKKYVPPKFKISFETDKTYYLLGESLKGKIKATDMLGKPISNAQVEERTSSDYVYGRALSRISGRSNEDGIFEFNYNLDDNFGRYLGIGPGRLFFNVFVTDQAQYTEEIAESVAIAESPISIVLIPENGSLVPGVENIIYIITSYPDGQPASATVQIKGQSIKTNEFGVGEIKVADIPAPTYLAFAVETISASAEDNRGNKGSITRDLNVRLSRDLPKPEGILLSTDKSVLEIGDTVNLQIFTPHSKGVVYLNIMKNKRMILTKALDVRDGIASMALDLDETTSGALELHAYKILKNSEIVQDTKTIFVSYKKDLQLDIYTDKSVYSSGEIAKISLMTTQDSKGVPGVVGVNIIDESVLDLKEERLSFRKLYFLLKREWLLPWAMIYDLTPSELISKNFDKMNANTRVEVGNALMAGIQGYDQSSKNIILGLDKDSNLKAKKTRHFNILVNIIVCILIFIFITAAVLTIYDYRKKKMMLLKDLWAGFLVLLKVVLVFVLAGGYLLILTLPGIWWKNILIGVLCMMVAAYIFIFYILMRCARRNDPMFFWINFLALVYVFASIFICIILSKVYHLNSSGTLAIEIASFVSIIFAIFYAKHALGFTKKEERLKHLTLIMVLLFACCSSSFYFGMKYIEMKRNRPRITIGFRMPMPEEIRLETYRESNMYDLSKGVRDMGISHQNESLKSDHLFPETLYSNPQIITDQNGRATIEVKMPDSKTLLRLTAVANSPDGNVASNDLSIQVK